MPELGEVEFYRRTWDGALRGQTIRAVETSGKRPFQGEAAALQALVGARLLRSESGAKQMLFQFRKAAKGPILWLGIHLGMSGELVVEPADFRASRHDHLILRTRAKSAVYNDPRMFGRVEFNTGAEPPSWWARLAAPVLSAAFTPKAVAAYLHRRQRAPLKAVLLQQERFPGVGNWMADEILWRAGLHPARAAGSLSPKEIGRLWRACREVCRLALRVIGGKGGRLPASPNARIPSSWLFRHRWAAGGRDPQSGELLKRATIGGRTTVWSPSRQALPAKRGTRSGRLLQGTVSSRGA
jgi:formamidopyrimidine-DNA glycosylase